MSNVNKCPIHLQYRVVSQDICESLKLLKIFHKICPANKLHVEADVKKILNSVPSAPH